MNAGLWTVLFGLLTTALLGLPFFPVWREWWRPRDAQALALHNAHAVAAQALTAQVRLSPGLATPPVVSASARILALAGCEFQQLNAPTILLGVASPVHTHAARQVPRTVLQQPPHAERWGAHGWRITGDCHIPDAHQLQGPIVVLGRLSVGLDCLIDGDVKAHGSVQMGARSRVTGALVSDQRIELHEGAWLQGPVLSESEVTLAGGVVIGSLEQPGTVRAAQVLAQAGAVVHGSICATQCGHVA